MSYGYYRIGSGKDPSLARSRLVAAMRQEADSIDGQIIKPPGIKFTPVAAIPAPPAKTGPAIVDTLVAGEALPGLNRKTATQFGYTGNCCPTCASYQMVRNGTCEKCESCGNTTGCS